LEKLIPELQSKGQVEFHLFMLMLLTGARREEISQLQACHLHEEDGFLITSIADTRQSGVADMEIKNHASARPLPVAHSVVPGLAERVSECIRNNGALFPELIEDQHGDRSNRESKRINRLIDKVIGKDRRYVLQSTRPTAAVVLRRAGMDTRLRRRFLGHTDGDIHEAHYEPGEILTSEDFIPLAIALRDFVKPLFPAIPDKPKVIAIHDAPSSLGHNDGDIYRHF
jgi:integrase